MAKPAEEQSKSQPKAKVEVKYTGPTIHTRILSKQDFAAKGVEGMDDQQWDLSNKHTVDASDWPAGALDVVRAEPDFRVSGADQS